jgi:hypothetical protein
MSQQCSVCGQSYGITHTCPGAIASVTLPPEKEWVRPNGFAPLYYIREPIGVARFEDAAIIGASRDGFAFLYGALFWLIGRLLIYGVPLYPYIRAAMNGSTMNWARIEFLVAFSIAFDAFVFVVQYGLAHSLARWWFGARGSYAGILRAMLMGSIVTCIYPVPYVGTWVAGIWMIAILMRVFEEVDGIERMKAFGLSAGINILFFAILLELAGARR